MRRLTALALPVLVIGSAWLLISRAGLIGLGHRSTALTITQLQLQSKLSVLRVPVTDVQTTELNGYVGGVQLVLQVHGDVELMVDLSQAQLEDIDESTRCATLVLPDPIPSRPRLDHERTRIYQIDRTGLWQIVPGQAAEAKLVDAAMAEAQRTLERAAHDPEIIQQARAHAVRLMQDAAASLGWTLEVR